LAAACPWKGKGGKKLRPVSAWFLMYQGKGRDGALGYGFECLLLGHRAEKKQGGRICLPIPRGKRKKRAGRIANSLVFARPALKSAGRERGGSCVPTSAMENRGEKRRVDGDGHNKWLKLRLSRQNPTWRKIGRRQSRDKKKRR